MRTVVVVAVLAAILAVTGQFQPFDRDFDAHLCCFLTLSGLATGASWLCYFRALKLGDAARVAPIDKLSTVLVAVFGVAFLGERLSAPNWLGIILIGCGALLVAHKGLSSASAKRAFARPSWVWQACTRRRKLR